MEHHPWTRFVAIGDSITEGYGMDPVEGVEHLPWAERLARELRATRPAFELHNLAWRNLRAAEIVESQLLRARMEVLHDAIRALASRHGALVVDVFADPESANPALFSADRQHANAMGQAYVAGRTLAALEAEAMRRSSAAA